MKRVVWLSDIHLNFLNPKERETFFSSILEQNPDALFITGDIAEAPTLEPLLMEMNQSIQRPVYFVLGNHDTWDGNYYEDGQLVNPNDILIKVFPEDQYPGIYPLNQSYDINGVHFIQINHHEKGWLDTDQQGWLIADIESIDPETNVFIFGHLPIRSMSQPESLMEHFSNHRGTVEYVCGHSHDNFITDYYMNHTIFRCREVSAGNVNSRADNYPFGNERPGYAIFCIENGDTKGFIYKRMDRGYRVEA